MLTLAGSTYATIVLGLITGPIIARVLGPAGRGEIASVQVYASLVTTLLAFGISTAVLHAIRRGPGSEGRILEAVLRYSFWLIPLSLCAAAVVSEFVLVNLHGGARVWCFVLIASTPLTVVVLSLTSFLLARGALGWIGSLRTLSTVCIALVVIVLAAVGHLTVTNYLAAIFAVSILVLAMSFRAVRVRPASGGSLRPLLAFGSKAWVGSLAGLANLGVDQAVIAPFLGSTELGHYAVAVTLSLLPLGISTAVGARIWGDVAADDGVNLERTGRFVRIAMSCATWVAIGLATTTPFLVPLVYGELFRASVLPLMLLLPGTIAFSGAYVLEGALVLAGRPGTNSKAELAALLCTAIGLAALLPTIGIVGAAVTTSIAYSVRFGFQIRALRRLGALDWRPRWTDMRYVVGEGVDLLRRAARGLIPRRAA